MHHPSYAVGAVSLSRALESLLHESQSFGVHTYVYSYNDSLPYHRMPPPVPSADPVAHNVGIYYVLLEGQSSATHMRSLRKPIQKSSRGLEWRDGQLLPYLHQTEVGESGAAAATTQCSAAGT